MIFIRISSNTQIKARLELLVVVDRRIGSVAGVVVTYVDLITWDGRVTTLVNVIAALVDGVTVIRSCEALYSVEPTVLEDGCDDVMLVVVDVSFELEDFAAKG